MSRKRKVEIGKVLLQVLALISFLPTSMSLTKAWQASKGSYSGFMSRNTTLEYNSTSFLLLLNNGAPRIALVIYEHAI